MKFHWVQERTNQGQYIVIWIPDDTNLADYLTRHHPPSHHQQVRPMYLVSSILKFKSIKHLRVCLSEAQNTHTVYGHGHTGDI